MGRLGQTPVFRRHSNPTGTAMVSRMDL